MGKQLHCMIPQQYNSSSSCTLLFNLKTLKNKENFQQTII